MKSTIVNLTPHPIRVLDEDGTLVREIPTSGTMARLDTQRTPADELDGLPVTDITYGATDGMPAPTPGVWHLVSLATALALVGQRDDLLVIDQEVRNETGTIIGCRCLGRPKTA